MKKSIHLQHTLTSGMCGYALSERRNMYSGHISFFTILFSKQFMLYPKEAGETGQEHKGSFGLSSALSILSF